MAIMILGVGDDQGGGSPGGANYIVQESDGTSKILLETSGALIQEA